MSKVQDDTVGNNQSNDLNDGDQVWQAPDFKKESIDNTQAGFTGMGADNGAYS